MVGRGEGLGGSGIVRLGNISKLKGMAPGGVEGWETWCMSDPPAGRCRRPGERVCAISTNKQTKLISFSELLVARPS